MTDPTEAQDQDRPDQASVARLTTEIVSAYVAHNPVAASDLPRLIIGVGAELRAVGRQEEPAPEKPQPAVPIRRSIQPDRLTCLVCGKRHKMLKRHLASEHGLTPNDYRELFGLKPDYPMVAPTYSKQRAELAQKIGLGRLGKKPGARRRRSARAP
jgi:predicted transcriptional regulator